MKKTYLLTVAAVVLSLLIAVGCSKKRGPGELTESSVSTATYTHTFTRTATNTATLSLPTSTHTATSSIPTNTPTATQVVSTGPPYTFETSDEGFVNDIYSSDLAFTAAVRSTADFHSGAASLMATGDFTTSALAQGYVYKDLDASPINMTGKQMSVWINVPASIAGTGFGLQMVAKLTSAKNWNAQWFNLDTAGWKKFVWEVNAADVYQIGVMLCRNSGFAYSGNIYIDDIEITDIPVVTSAVHNFDLSSEGFVNDTVTDVAVSAAAWNTAPAGLTVGAGSLALTADFSTSATAQGYIYKDFASSPLDLTGKTVSVLVYTPANMVGYGMQIACKTGAAKNWHAGWITLDTAGWKKYSWLADLADVQEVGLQFLRNNVTTPFTGTFYIDELNY